MAQCRTRLICAAMAAALFGGADARAQPEAIRLDLYASGFSNPVAFVQDPRHDSVQYVVQQRGLIRRIIDGEVSDIDFISLVGIVSSAGLERGLLGLAFPPDAEDDRFYVCYTRNSDGAIRIVRYSRMAGDPLRGDPATAEPLITIPHPIDNHNGGNLMFGPDGFLYAGIGDGGGAGDQDHNAQDPNTLLGKMIRIDVSPQSGYDVPPDNPFVDSVPVHAREEIWAFGLRNPWRWSFDDPDLGGTGAMIIGDVGQNAFEEINYEPMGARGRNYGWRIREGAHDYDDSEPPAYLPLTGPIFEYDHGEGRVVTGGVVYRGQRLGLSWRGRYLFAEFGDDRLFSILITPDAQGEGVASDLRDHTEELGGAAEVARIASFGVDADGEIHVVRFDGAVFQIAPVVESFAVPPAAIAATRGTRLGGNLLSIVFSDPYSYRIASAAGTVYHVCEATVRLTSPTPAPDDLNLLIETRAIAGNVQTRVYLHNWTGGSWDQVAAFPQPPGDFVRFIGDIDSPANYVRASDGYVRMRIQMVRALNRGPFNMWIDHVAADVSD